jgi:hypothetical protein
MTAVDPKIIRTMWPMNCHPTFCGMLIEMEGGKLKTAVTRTTRTVRASFACVAAAPTRFLAIRDARCTPKLVMIAARVPGAA